MLTETSRSKFSVICIALSMFVFSLHAQSPRVSFGTELERLFRTDKLASFNTGSVVEQMSSYDRKGKNNDGFEGTWSFVRKNDDGSLVIFDAPGKGVIERIWTPTPTDEILDFYFDGKTTPSFSIKFNDLFSGKVSPFLNPVAGKKVGGWYSYIPIPYANGCKIVLRGKKMLFYQVQYRQFTDDRIVETFKPKITESEGRLLSAIVNQWSSRPSVSQHSGSKIKTIEKKAVLKPGHTLTIADVTSGGRILGIEFDNPAVFEGLSNAVDIRISWDGDTNPAVYAPVADFFGYAFGTTSMQSIFAGANSDRTWFFLPMPFDKSAKVELVYRKLNGVEQKDISIGSTVSWTAESRDKKREGKFYTYWKRELPAIGKPYVFLEGKGRGHIVGTVLYAQSRTYDRHTEFFEGDDSTVLDGKHLLHGTGSEDYFNGGWYAQPEGWTERKGAPIHGCLEYSLPLSRTAGYRFYITDKLPFANSIYHSIEHGPEGNNRSVMYTSLAMYYADASVQDQAKPANENTAIFIPDTLSFYPRLMKHVQYEGDAKLANGNAVMPPNGNGSFLLETRELSPGRYKILAFGKGTRGARLNGAEFDELKATMEGPNDMRSYRVGYVTISEPGEPLRLPVSGNTDELSIHFFNLVKE